MPYPNEHSCRLVDPGQFTAIRRKNAEEVDNGRPIDVVYGIRGKSGKRGGKTQIQALRYNKEVWNEQDAEMHCILRGGRFEPASEPKQ